jgi:hypothetical protein
MTDLSPAAQAVLNAADSTFDQAGTTRQGLAAALRAAADCVVPWKPEPTENSVGPTVDFGYAWALFSKANDIRQELIAIADELDGHEQISEEENEVRFKACMGAISDLKHGEITELMGEAFMEEFKRVSQR